MTKKGPEVIPSENRERLVNIFHPKRATFIFYYVFGVVLFIIGLGFNVTSAAGFIIHDLFDWTLGITSMIFGILIVTWAESRRWFTLYIITTWNVRVRRGIFSRETVRIFYDEITDVHCSGPPDERRVGMGDVEIFTSADEGTPSLLIDGVNNPDGIKEIILRFMRTIPDPLHWAHLDRD